MKVFLGGTCNGSKWRDELIPLLKVDYFNPVVENWTEADYQEELKQRKECGICLYVITPKMTGVYSIAEVIDDSNKRPEKTIFCVLGDWDDGQCFTDSQLKSLDAVGKMVKSNGGEYFEFIGDVANHINYRARKELNPKALELKNLIGKSREERLAYFQAQIEAAKDTNN